MWTRKKGNSSNELEEAVRELIKERNQLLQQRDALAAELLAMKKAANQEPKIFLHPVAS